MGSTMAHEQQQQARLAAALGARLAGRALVRLAAPEEGPLPAGVEPVRHYPLLELLAGVDLVVGAGGYNTVHEARACRRPLLALARPRLYDRQARRLTSGERVADAAAFPALIERWLGSFGPRPLPPYASGCAPAVEAVLALP
jgi:hypothetical protein